MEWRLDKEGKEFHHFDDFCRMYQAEIKNLNRVLESLVRTGVIPGGFQLSLTGSQVNQRVLLLLYHLIRLIHCRALPRAALTPALAASPPPGADTRAGRLPALTPLRCLAARGGMTVPTRAGDRCRPLGGPDPTGICRPRPTGSTEDNKVSLNRSGEWRPGSGICPRLSDRKEEALGGSSSGSSRLSPRPEI